VSLLHLSVYLATKKTINKKSFCQETDLDEIKEEVEILRSLNHPCIVDYEETFEGVFV